MRTLICSGCTVTTELKRDMTALWCKVMRRLNSEDIVLFDTASTIDPRGFVEPGIMIERFDDNPGHLAHGGRDGWGRSFCAGLEKAIALKYDYAVFCEADNFFIRPIHEVVARVARSNVQVATLQMPFYQFFESAFSIWNVDWLKRTNFIERYDWRTAKPVPIPEQRVEWLCGADLFILPYRGIRNSGNWMTPQNIAQMFPYGPPDWLHENNAKDLDTIQAFLHYNKIEV